MAIRFGDGNPSKIYFGQDEVDRAFLGVDEVWNKAGAPNISQFVGWLYPHTQQTPLQIPGNIPDRLIHRSETPANKEYLGLGWSISNHTSFTLKKSTNGVVTDITPSNTATTLETSIEPPDSDTVYLLAATNVDGTSQKNVLLIVSKNVAISNFTAVSRGNTPLPGGGVVNSEEVTATIVGHPRPDVTITASTGGFSRRRITWDGNTGTLSARWSGYIDQGHPRNVRFTLTADNHIPDGTPTGFVGRATRTLDRSI